MSHIFSGTAHPHGLAAIHAEKEYVDFDNPNLWPILLAYRPFTPGFGIAPEDLRFEPNRVQVEQRECAVVRHESNRFKTTFYVDEANDCVIRRFERRNDRPFVRIDMSYSRTGDQFVYPAAWTILVGDQQVERSARMSKIELNVQIPEGEFAALDFPVGTQVDDRRDGWLCWQRENGLERFRQRPVKKPK